MNTLDIILSTRNPGKVEQIKAIFENLPIQVLTLEDALIVGETIEDGNTLEENAFKKALFAWEQTKKWCVADDSGFFIDALSGAPGVFSARWAGENATTDEITDFTLKQLAHVPPPRTGTAQCVVAIISPAEERYIFRGILHGMFSETPQGPRKPGMPYYPIFIPKGGNKTFSEMTLDEVNAISHRGQAFRKVGDFFKKRFS